jgi:glyoxylase-like metal-dependent hydrolase (beta-lactamase superfamily II)
MKKLSMKKWALPFGFGLLFVSAAATASRSQGPEFKVHAVGGTVSYVEGAGGNIGVCAGPDGLFVIDDQLVRFREDVVAAVHSVGEGPVRFLVNTHWHGDHTGNNDAFAPETTILSHENVRRRLAADPELEGGKGDDVPAAALPVLTYQQSVKLYVNGEEVEITHYPRAHTDGDSVVYFKTSNVLHMGDLLFNGLFPFIDLTSGGSVQGYLDAVATILKHVDPETKIIAGHGPLASVDDLREYHSMLVTTTQRVRKALGEGKTVDQMKADGLLSDYESWSWGFIDSDKYLEALAEDLAR